MISVEIFATISFALAILHTFLVKHFQHLALRFSAGSPGKIFFHLLGEVEIVFGVWATIFHWISAGDCVFTRKKFH